MDIMKLLQPIGQLYKNENFSEALVKLEQLWETIPEPKEDILNSYSIVSYGAIISLKFGDLDRAWEWAKRGLAYSGKFNLLGESEFLAGEVAYARSAYEEAAKYFLLVKKMSGKRLFKGKNPEYEKLMNKK